MTELERLCGSCAKCCDRTLFAVTMLDREEQKRFQLPVLGQPCPHLAGRRCGIYATRPRACVEYLCPTAAALQRGELGLAEAAATLGVTVVRSAPEEIPTCAARS